MPVVSGQIIIYNFNNTSSEYVEMFQGHRENTRTEKCWDFIKLQLRWCYYVDLNTGPRRIKKGRVYAYEIKFLKISLKADNNIDITRYGAVKIELRIPFEKKGRKRENKK